MAVSRWAVPPEIDSKERREYDLDLHNHIYGLGTDGAGQLNVAQNAPTVTAGLATTISVADAVANQHDPGTNHKILKQAVDPVDTPADAAASAVAVTSPNATDLATVITLANEIKGDVNQLVTDLNAVVTKLNTTTTKLNALMANMRTAKLLP